METYYYKCPICGFVYQVPDYWVDFAPEATTEFPHISFKTGAPCENAVLEFAGDTERGVSAPMCFAEGKSFAAGEMRQTPCPALI